MEFYKKFTRRLRSDGLISLTRSVPRFCIDRVRELEDRRFDARLGTQTASIGSLKRTYNDTLGPDGGENQGHQPIQGAVFRRIMRDFKRIASPSQFVFVDIGSGRGRAVLMAAENQFKYSTGIEFSKEMYSCAEENARSFRLRANNAGPVEFKWMDAAEYSFPRENIVCYLYNPFGPQVMDLVLANLKDSLEKYPREVYMVYRNPLLASRIAQWDFLKPVVHHRSFIIYKNRLHEAIGGASESNSATSWKEPNAH